MSVLVLSGRIGDRWGRRDCWLARLLEPIDFNQFCPRSRKKDCILPCLSYTKLAISIPSVWHIAIPGVVAVSVETTVHVSSTCRSDLQCFFDISFQTRLWSDLYVTETWFQMAIYRRRRRFQRISRRTWKLESRWTTSMRNPPNQLHQRRTSIMSPSNLPEQRATPSRASQPV